MSEPFQLLLRAHTANVDEKLRRLSAETDKAYSAPVGTILFGKVVKAVQVDGWYTVALSPPHRETLECVSICQNSGLLGSKVQTVIPPESVVMVVPNPTGQGHGIIIGVVPNAGFHYAEKAPIGTIHGLTRSGYVNSDYDRIHTDKSNEMHSNDGKPIDASAIGNFTVANMFGGIIHMSPFLLTLGQGELNRITFSYLNRLLRISSDSFQKESHVSSLFEMDDHKWDSNFKFDEKKTEALSHTQYYVRGVEAYGDLEKTGYENGKRNFDNKNRERNKFKNQVRKARIDEFSGWLGQGKLLSMSAEPEDDNDPASKRAKLLTEYKGVDGTYHIKAAGMVAIERSVNIPYFEQIERLEKSYEDLDKDYQFGGDEGDQLYFQGNDPQIVRSLLVGDIIKKQEYKEHYALLKRAKQFKFEDTSDSNRQLSRNQYTRLKTEQDGGLTDSILQNAESLKGSPIHGATELKYLTKDTGFYLLPDGGFCIKDAFGNMIRSNAGGIDILPVADANIRPGRRAVIMSGDDTIITANKSIDITAAQNDIHIAGWNNVEIVSGLSKRGRTLIENKSQASLMQYSTEDEDTKIGEDQIKGGIILKSDVLIEQTKEHLVDASREYLNTSQDQKNYGRMQMNGFTSYIVNFIDNSEIIKTGTIMMPGVTLHYGFTEFDNTLTVNGQVIVAGQCIVDGSMMLHGSVLATGGYAGPSQYVAKLSPKSRKDMIETVAEIADAIDIPDSDNPKKTEDAMISGLQSAAFEYTSRTLEQLGVGSEYVFTQYETEGIALPDQFKLTNIFGYFSGKEDEIGAGVFPGKDIWEGKSIPETESVYGDKNHMDIEVNKNLEIKEPKLVSPKEGYKVVVCS